MKYIRTKDGRIIDCRFSKQEYERDYPNSKVSYERWFELAFETDTDYEILNQADTIEELCDEFRGVWTNYYEDGKDAHEEYHYDKEKNVFYDDFEELTHKEAIEKFDIFYGAIWTDKGLIYVAKMNEKGELELL